MIRRKYLLIPIFWGGVLAILAVTLLAIGARSPYTHTNLVPTYDPGYSRTTPIAVGTPVPFVPPGLNDQGKTGDVVTEGQRLFVALDCASCHGLKGEGGVFAPPIAGSDLQTVMKKLEKGPGGMPHFAALTQSELDALVAYLKSLVKPAAQAQGQ